MGGMPLRPLVGVGVEATPTRTSGCRAWAQHPPRWLRAPPARPRSKVNTAERTGARLAARRASHGGGGAGLPCGRPRPAPGYHPVVSVGTPRGGRCQRAGSPGGRERSTPSSGDTGGGHGLTHIQSRIRIRRGFPPSCPGGSHFPWGAIQPVRTGAELSLFRHLERWQALVREEAVFVVVVIFPSWHEL